jgi:hypothetical protein
VDELPLLPLPQDVVPSPSAAGRYLGGVAEDDSAYSDDPRSSSAASENEVVTDLVLVGYDDLAARAGWWSVARQGSLTKVGEYQDLKSSPFWDLDILKSDGRRTLDFFGTGLDNESTNASLYLYTPVLSTNLRYHRFLHRLDHDPLANIPQQESGAQIVKEDLNAGEDYAVRLQDIRTDVSGELNDNVKYQFDVWFRRKWGERQALGTHHGMPVGRLFCANCHIRTQRQEIDWSTTRFEPAIEARIGELTVEYSRPMRIFSQNDAIVTRSYGAVHPYDNYATDYPYAVVPENVSQIDRLKLSRDLPLESHVYSRLYRGDTRNLQRDTRRDFYGFDLRLSNDYFRFMTLNSFARWNRQLNQFPPFLIPPEGIATSVATAIIPPYDLRQPVDYLRMSTGLDATVRPLRGTYWSNSLLVNVGVELGLLKRSYAEYQVQLPPGFRSQRRTSFARYFAGTSMRWHPKFDTRLRYEHRNTSNPNFGLDNYWGITNSSQPTVEDVVRLDATWLAAKNLIATGSIAVETRQHHTDIAVFDEDNYPMTFTIWYAPHPAWSLSGGYGYYTNWIDQDMYFPSNTPRVEPFVRQEWNYGGRAQFLSIGGSFAWTKRLLLSGSLQYVWGLNTFDPLQPWPDLPFYSEVVVNTKRYVSGVDWSANQWAAAYLRYIFEDYADGSAEYNSGSAHLVLAGLSATL